MGEPRFRVRSLRARARVWIIRGKRYSASLVTRLSRTRKERGGEGLESKFLPENYWVVGWGERGGEIYDEKVRWQVHMIRPCSCLYTGVSARLGVFMRFSLGGFRRERRARDVSTDVRRGLAFSIRLGVLGSS